MSSTSERSILPVAAFLAGSALAIGCAHLVIQQRKERASSSATSTAAPAETNTIKRSASYCGRENPWKVSEGDRAFELGETVSISGTGHSIEELLLLKVPHLREKRPDLDAQVPNERKCATALGDDADSHGFNYPFLQFVDETSIIVGDIVRNTKQKNISRAYLRAGPRASLYFNPSTVKAAIVSCGGICPGLNNVIRELVMCLTYDYGCSTIYGVEYGYWGFHTPDAHVGPVTPNCPTHDPRILTPEAVASIHTYGGTVLGSDRGGHDVDVILRFCENRGINQLFVIGGDGTHRGAHAIYQHAASLGKAVSVCAIPKTIDNDVDIIDRSFGFDTAYTEAVNAIRTAKTEAKGAPNGIGIVKVMGRYAGFIAAFATIASGDVDLCLIPEVPIVLEGRTSILEHIKRTVLRQGHAVIVIAEGAGEETLNEEIIAAGGTVELDAGGNRKLPPVGPWLQRKVGDYFKSVGIKVNMKYIDPSYIIRSVPANSSDAVYCTLLSQAAVHGTMAGFTGFSVGMTNNRLVYLPITAITANSPRCLNPRGRTYERLLSVTHQPDPLSDDAVYADWMMKKQARNIPKAGS